MSLKNSCWAPSSEPTSPTTSFLKLEGKKIVKVHVQGVNCVTLETDTGEFFMIETVCILPSLGLYGMEVLEVSKDSILNECCDRR